MFLIQNDKSNAIIFYKILCNLFKKKSPNDTVFLQAKKYMSSNYNDDLMWQDASFIQYEHSVQQFCSTNHWKTLPSIQIFTQSQEQKS